MASTVTMTVPALAHAHAHAHSHSRSHPDPSPFHLSSTAASSPQTSCRPSHVQPHVRPSGFANHDADLNFRIPQQLSPSQPQHPQPSSAAALSPSVVVDGPRPHSYVANHHLDSLLPSPLAKNSHSAVSSPTSNTAPRDGGVMISLERPDQAALAAAHTINPSTAASSIPAQQHQQQQQQQPVYYARRDASSSSTATASAAAVSTSATASPSTGVNTNSATSSAPRTRAQQHASSRTRETKFGDYVLGRTLGEGEFGKVKMGWKREGSVQVAIKLIRRESIKGNSRQLPKISREIAILRKLKHSHIVRLVEIVETERHIGIILEYASGGELFDYILKSRYLKDSSARRLFAQLISGVGYLHKNGIVHRDLKLENLLLDRNNNIIITDFGFANTFNPTDELTTEAEGRLGDHEYVKATGLDHVSSSTGFRRGDLMQTSCGSPCYAAPELVVSDSLYTGRKVDVWSCGVILYAMLAGYLPFDDDPENPEADNIHKLYQYIVSTPLTFPEWVTPHARDLLKRMLVPKPTERADLFEVARHSWLSPYAPLLSSITSTATNASGDVTPAVAMAGDDTDSPALARSASVREPFKKHAGVVSPVGGLTSKQGNVDVAGLSEQRKTPKEAKRRTVQVEYVPPQSASTSQQRNSSVSSHPDRQSSTRDRTGSSYSSRAASPGRSGIPVRRQPAAASAAPSRSNSTRNYRSPSVNHPDSTRPSTRGSANILINGHSKGQPAPPKLASETASGYITPHSRTATLVLCNQPASRSNSQRRAGALEVREKPPSSFMSAARGHKRSSTIGGGVDHVPPPASARTSIFGGKDYAGRPSSESRRMSFAFSRRNSTAAASKAPETPVAPGSSSGLPKSRHGSHRLSSFLTSTTSLVRTLTGGAYRDSHIPNQSAVVSRVSSPVGSMSKPGPRPVSGSVNSRFDGNYRSSIPVPKSQYTSRRNSIVSNYSSAGPRPTITKVVEDPLDTDVPASGHCTPAPIADGHYPADYAPHTSEGVQAISYPAGMGSHDDEHMEATPSYSNGSGRGQGPARRMMDFFRKRNKRDSSVPVHE